MKHSLAILTAVFEVFVFLISCGGSAETGTIYGIVSDRTTGDPIYNAIVELLQSKRSIPTGSDGYFAMDIPEGKCTLLITKTGYADAKIDNIIIESGKWIQRDIPLEKMPPALQIRDADNREEIWELDFGAEIDSRLFNIFNGGEKKLEWQTSFSADWIKEVIPEKGELEPTDNQGVIVYIDRSLLPKRDNATKLIVTSKNGGNKELTIKATSLDPCKADPCVHGTCKAMDSESTGSETYKCICDDKYFFNGTECVNPCEENPCIVVANSTGECVAKNAAVYLCKCKNNYDWKNFKCEAAQQTVNCTEKPENTVWNTVSTITQTWNGSEWSPSNTSIYNTTASSKECRFKCNTNYNWNDSSSTCVAATKAENCSSKPLNSIWNDGGKNGKFTQTWNGAAWYPANKSSTYSETAGECRFKCDAIYEWDGTACVLPECSATSMIPCMDSTSGLIWSEKVTGSLTWNDAKVYCNSLNASNYAGFSNGWHLPIIDELRTLIKGTNSITGGACKVSEVGNCVSSVACWSRESCSEKCTASECQTQEDGRYSKLGDWTWFWSSTTIPDRPDDAWLSGFGSGSVGAADRSKKADVRCVKTTN
ncbi:DUF1566 domain-containing protein [bacterium]|nr:DUF1566 domain-containing protein [bacterium]